MEKPDRDATAPADPGPEDMPAPESPAGEPHQPLGDDDDSPSLPPVPANPD